MQLYGYARVSTTSQDLTLQEEKLRAAGCQVIRAEKRSGGDRAGRSELQTLLEFLRAGDTLVVTRIDRLARSVRDLQDIVDELRAKSVALKATEQPVDTSSAAGKAFLDMLGVFAEFETSLRRERQLAAILGFSGALVGAGGLKEQMCSKPPTMLIHGDRDPMIPIPAMFESAEGLAAAGHGALWHISYGVPHSIGQDGLDLGGDFLASCLKTQVLVSGA